MNEFDGSNELDKLSDTEYDWDAFEEDHFTKIECIRVRKKGKEYQLIGEKALYNKLNKNKGIKKIERIVANPRTYLDNAKNPVIPYGFWTCKCKTKWLRTPFTNVCSKCNCSITSNTKKASYLEEIKL